MHKTKITIYLAIIFFGFFGLAGVASAATPVVYFSDMTDGATSGWEGSTTKGVAVSIWGNNFGTSRGVSSLNVCGVTLSSGADFAEWGGNN